MASSILSVYASIQQNDYITVAIVSVIAYDYVLLFPKEVKYIWSQPWTMISSLYILVRYVGLFQAIWAALFGSTFVPGPSKICNAFNLVVQWTYPVFISAADLTMILRVYAMCLRSRIILGILLMVYIPEVIFLLVTVGIFTSTKVTSDTFVQVLDVSICVTIQDTSTTAKLDTVASILPIVLNALICMFAIIQFAKESLAMYRVTKQWQPNQYINMLTRDGMLYFIASLLSLLCNLLGVLGVAPSGGSLAILTFVISFIPLFPLTPRFILSVRELYDHDLNGRFRGAAAGIDTGFGLSLPAGIGNAMEFVDNGQIEEVEGEGEVQRMEQRSQTSGIEC